jgi:hypothetical protein
MSEKLEECFESISNMHEGNVALFASWYNFIKDSKDKSSLEAVLIFAIILQESKFYNLFKFKNEVEFEISPHEFQKINNITEKEFNKSLEIIESLNLFKTKIKSDLLHITINVDEVIKITDVEFRFPQPYENEE